MSWLVARSHRPFRRSRSTASSIGTEDYFLTRHCNTWWIILLRRSRLIFHVDLFPAHGCLPDNLDEVNEREKDVRYSSRTRLTTDTLREKHDVRHAINELHKLLPRDIASTEQAKRLYEYGCVTEMDIVQLVYRPIEPQGALKDFQFGRSTMEARWQQGLSDARTNLHASPWLAPMPKELGVRVFDVIHEILVGHRKEAA